MNPQYNSPESSYNGIDNLEVMAEAVNYNGYLNALVLKHTSRSQRIVDFGSGIGTFAEPLKRIGKDVICIEPDVTQRAVLSQKNLACFADISQMQDNSVDAIYTLNVLEHIPDDIAALRLLYEKLIPGGNLLVYVPAFQILYSSMDKKVGHCRRYRRKELIEKIRLAGFQVRASAYADSLGFLASLVYKYLDKQSGDINKSALKIYDRFVFPVSRVIDKLTGKWFGKNVLVIANKPR